MADKVRVVLPEKYDLVAGENFQLFYRGVIEAPNPYLYNIVTICEIGKDFPRYFECCPEKEGEYKLAISLYDTDKTLICKGETVLKVVAPKQQKDKVNVLCIGDSLTCGGEWVNEVNRRISEKDGEPKGLGFENVNFVGSCTNSKVDFVAFGGWRWDCYATVRRLAVWFECEHNKDEKDQHSLWTDDEGNLWQLETIEKGRLKFLRYGLHSASRPEKVNIKHYQNAVHQDEIYVEKSYDEAKNPFYDVEKEKIDILKFCRKNDIDKLDVIYIFLGANHYWERERMTLDELCCDVVSKARELLSYIKEAFPDVKIRIMGKMLSSVNGGGANNYGASFPLSDWYEGVRYTHYLNEAYEKLAKEYDNTEFVNISGQFDCEYCYPYEMKKVNARSSFTERLDTNASHPTNDGYMMVADAVYRNLVATLVDF